MQSSVPLRLLLLPTIDVKPSQILRSAVKSGSRRCRARAEQFFVRVSCALLGIVKPENDVEDMNTFTKFLKQNREFEFFESTLRQGRIMT